MGNRWSQQGHGEQGEQEIKTKLSKPIRNFETEPQPMKAFFSKLPPKPTSIDDEVAEDINSSDCKDKHLGESSSEGENVGDENDELYQEGEEVHETVQEEIKIKWNSFIKLKKMNYLEEYTVLKEIGRGGFGTVSKVRAKFTGVLRAAKKIKKNSLAKDDHEKLFEEMAIMISLDHPNISRLFEVYDYKSHYVLILELCEGGELFKRVVNHKTTEAVAVDVMAQLLQALVYIHGRGIVHRDLKPENLLFQNSSNYLKLIDFGIAAHYKPNEPLTTRIGTPYYIAPEVLCKNYGPKCDIWSTGIILYMMLAYRPPFSGDNELEVMEKIIKTEPSYKSSGLVNASANCIDFLKRMIIKNPDKRPSAFEAYNHPWIQEHVKEASMEFRSKTQTMENLSTFKFSNKLEAVVYTYIVSQILSSEEKRVLKDLFSQLDHNHDGVISTIEFKEALLVKKEMTDERINFLVKIIDTNGSGEIDFTEFVVAALQPESLTNKHFEQAFSYFDIDHSGTITYDEIASFLGGDENSQEEILNIFKEVDQNCDGIISKEEFLQILTRHARESRQEKVRLRKVQSAKQHRKDSNEKSNPKGDAVKKALKAD